MKYIFTFLFLTLFFIGNTAPIKFYSGSFSDLQAEAKRSQKYIFIDFYTDWCRPCLMMQAATFTDDSLGNFLNRHVLAYKVNCEKDTVLKAHFQAPSIPYWIFVSPDGEVKFSYEGYADATFILYHAKEILNYSDEKYYYQLHPNDVLAVQNYAVSIVSYFPDSSERIIERFLANIPSEKWVQNPFWNITKSFIFHIESPVFQYIAAHAGACQTQQNETRPYLDEKFEAAHKKVFHSLDRDELEVYKNIYATAMVQLKVAPSIAACKGEIEAEFLLKVRDDVGYLAFVNDYLKNNYPKVSQKYAEYALTAVKNFKNTEVLNAAEEWAKNAIEYDNINANAYYSLAYVKFRKNDNANALRLADKAKLYALTPGEKGAVDDLIQKIQNRIK